MKKGLGITIETELSQCVKLVKIYYNKMSVYIPFLHSKEMVLHSTKSGSWLAICKYTVYNVY